QPSSTAIEALTALAQDADFAVIVLSPDDITLSRGNRRPSPRDNAIFELGLFMGAIGRDRTCLFKPQGMDIKIPSDLMGVTCVEYVHPQGPSGRLRIAAAVNRLAQAFGRLGPR
ncbi:MAG: TIR domain-containing protein, partial [Planctomycetota bacterium]